LIIRQRGNAALVIVTVSRILATAGVYNLRRCKQVNLTLTRMSHVFAASITIGIHSAINATSRLLGLRVRRTGAPVSG